MASPKERVRNVASVRQLGFGCGGLFGLPGRRDRRTVLAAAYALGIRHFDVAPIYGLGLAEAELGAFLRGLGDDVHVATKFGIRPTVAARIVGRVQGPVRRALRQSIGVKNAVKSSGRSASAGVVGRALYTVPRFTVTDFRYGLRRSMRALGVSHVDYFLLHEPRQAFLPSSAELADALDSERTAGRIGSWGLSGDLTDVDPATPIVARAETVQYPYDLVHGERRQTHRTSECLQIVYGALSGALGPLASLLSGDPDLARLSSDAAGVDLRQTSNLVGVLLRDALAHVGSDGLLLVSTTNVAHLEAIAAAAGPLTASEAGALSLLRAGLARQGRGHD